MNNNSPWKTTEILKSLSTKGKPQKTKSYYDILSPHVFFLPSLPFSAVFLLQRRNGPQDHSVNVLCPLQAKDPCWLPISTFCLQQKFPAHFSIPQGLYSFL